MAKRISARAPHLVWSEEQDANTFNRILERVLREIITRVKRATDNHASILEGASDPIKFPSYTVATLPNAASWEQGIIYVSDESGGATLAFSNGSNWLRLRDNAVVT